MKSNNDQRKSCPQGQLSRLEAVFDSAIDGVIIVDANGIIQAFNPAAERIFGYSDLEVNNGSIDLLIPPDCQKLTGANRPSRQSNGEQNAFDILDGKAAGKHKNGTTLSLQIFASEMLFEGQRLLAGFVREVTDCEEAGSAPQKTLTPSLEQKRETDASRKATLAMLRNVEAAKEQLKKSKIAAQEQATRIKAIVDCATDAIITIDIRGTVESLNKAAETIFGYTASEMVGENVKMLMPAPFYAEHDGYLETYEKTGVRHVIGIGREVIGKRKDGSVFPLDLSVSEVQLDGQRLFTGIIRDITDRKEAEQQQLKLNQELKEQSQQIANANATLQRSNEELKQFAYVASHDLQEPLRKVNSFCQILLEEYGEQLDDTARTYIRYAVDGATRMRSLVSDLLDYSRVETQGKALEPTDAGHACAVAMQNLEGSIEECGAKIDIGSLPTILADSAQLVRLFQNLIGNAIKYRGEKTPEITVDALEQEGEQQWLLTIKDNGIGMEPQYFERIFVMFQRLHARKEYTGTGIGLAICKRIIDRMGGRIWVESELGEGSVFKILVPVITKSVKEGVEEDEHDAILVEAH